ncbi:unnamed protein product [Caenorhabditis auriculariae]|uniref:TIL domain-containing protein n=1 Tax=Caenorhabditis auriculariae TaxID=2777116 RepID=A0A8S1GT98_9PELO|nr:unnamed protein product [Caenorhabditis auriculariae]
MNFFIFLTGAVAEQISPKPEKISTVFINPIEFCGKFQERKKCGVPCEPRCSSNEVQGACPKICLPDVCQCIAGYSRNATDDCVPTSECKARKERKMRAALKIPKCVFGEVFSVCRDPCPPTCAEPERKCVRSEKMCILGCDCFTGKNQTFVRESEGGNCIPRDKCQINADSELNTSEESSGWMATDPATCDDVFCDVGSVCEIVDVPCETAPCLQQAICVGEDQLAP